MLSEAFKNPFHKRIPWALCRYIAFLAHLAKAFHRHLAYLRFGKRLERLEVARCLRRCFFYGLDGLRDGLDGILWDLRYINSRHGR